MAKYVLIIIFFDYKKQSVQDKNATRYMVFLKQKKNVFLVKNINVSNLITHLNVNWVI